MCESNCVCVSVFIRLLQKFAIFKFCLRIYNLTAKYKVITKIMFLRDVEFTKLLYSNFQNILKIRISNTIDKSEVITKNFEIFRISANI